MKHTEGTFTGFRGLQLYYQSWVPEEPTLGVVALVHGLGGHSGLFSNVVEYLTIQGYEVYSFDLRGHGRSPGQRGHINSWREFREDLHAFVQFIQEQRSCCPFVLWGHSLGGTIALDYALQKGEHIQAVIASAPALGKIRVAPTKLFVGRALSTIVPRFSLKVGISEKLGSRNDAIIAAYLDDPLRHQFGSARLAGEFFAAVSRIYKHAHRLQIPLLLMHGTDDQVTLPEGSREFFQRVIYPDKEHREYPGSYHDIYVDMDYREIFLDLENWLVRHFDGAGTCQSMEPCSVASQFPSGIVTEY
jgi:alpha-beta hydrolase superfamily lysophospholipase